MIAEIALYLAAACVSIGSLFGLLAAIGILRLPDLLTRMHAASKAGLIGAGLIMIGIAIASGSQQSCCALCWACCSWH